MALDVSKLRGLRIFDVHQHVGPLEFSVGSFGGKGGFSMEEDHERRVRVMDKFGITAAAVMPTSQYERPRGQRDTEELNNMISEYRRKYRDRFPVAFGTVEPLHGVEAGLREIDRIANELHLDGIVWHHRFQGTHIADSRMFKFLERMMTYGLPALVHVFSESRLEAPIELEALARAFPDIKFIALDALSSPLYANEMIEICKRNSNVYIDTAITYPIGRYIDKFVTEVGADRVLFGTDLYVDPPLYNYPVALGEILYSDVLSDNDREKILWLNAKRIFGDRGGFQ